MGNKNSLLTSSFYWKDTTQPDSAVANKISGPIDMRMIENIVLIWLDSSIDENQVYCKDIITQLRHSVKNIHPFIDADQCIEFIEGMDQEKICVIISGSLGQHIMPRIHNIFQVFSIFIFCGNKNYHEQWAKDWSKIKGVFTEIIPICKALKDAAQQSEHNTVSISFMATNDDVSTKKLDQLDCSFMYTQILKETLLAIDFKPKYFTDFIGYCHQLFASDDGALEDVKKLEQEYRSQTPIWWYTWESFLYSMLNNALRTMNADIIVRMGFFIKDLHCHIEQLHCEQFDRHSSGDTFTIYRGQGLLKSDFEQLVKTQGGLIAFNNFLSTSKKRDISLPFALNSLENPDMMGILFVMTINPIQSTTHFASITEVGYYGDREDEVLFAMHSVFRIREIERIDGNNRLYQVHLTMTNDNDKDLNILTERIRKEIPDSGWYRLGELLRKMGEFNKAEEVYRILLGQTTNAREKAPLYAQLASIKDDRGEYVEAIKFYKKSLAINEKTLPSHHPSLASSYNNIGIVYRKLDNYSKSLSYLEKGLDIKQQSLPPNHLNLSSSYNNIGNVCHDMGDYSKALFHYEKTLEIQQYSLTSTHPDLGASYNNIGSVYYKMGDYAKALSNYEKALEIRQQSLPAKHPDLGLAYDNIGLVYEQMGNYEKAYSCYERAVKIGKHSLSTNHPNRQIWRKHLADVKQKL